MKLLQKLRTKTTISYDRGLKLFKFFNTVVFCKVLNFHLPQYRNQRGFVCVICEKDF